jgi:hypothetical protein
VPTKGYIIPDIILYIIYPFAVTSPRALMSAGLFARTEKC